MDVKKNKIKAAALFILLMAVPLLAQAADMQKITPESVSEYVDESVNWYRTLPTLDPLATAARETTIRDGLKQNGNNVIRLSLDYARAQNTFLTAMTAPAPAAAAPDKDAAPAANNASANPDIKKIQADNAQHMTQLQAQVAQLNRAIAKASGRQKATLTAQRDKAQTEMNLVQAQRDLLQTVSGFISASKSDSATDGLPGKIAELEKLVPDAEATSQQQKNSTKVVVQQSDDKDAAASAAADNGIFSLIGNMVDSANKRGRLNDMIQMTDVLHGHNQDQLGALRDQLRQALARGNEIGAQSTVSDPAKIAAQQQELNGLVAKFKLLSASIAPIAEQAIWIEAAQRNLATWAKQFETTFAQNTQDMLIRLSLLALAILIPLVLSHLAQRGITKYVRDERRQRQLRTLRRTILIFVIVLIVTMNFFSEFGSIATYAGLLTAGLAVALQNVILSLAAHFMFFGRYSVRVGDRVTVSDVTGDIIDIGLLRFYMMELDSESLNPHPTGRVVAFPNSILFQQSAFYKQIPGTHYVWRVVTISLPAGIDYSQAQEKLMGALNTVYASYRTDMETQQSILESSTRLKVRLPQPEGNLRFQGDKMVYEARYPVETARSGEIDDKVTQQLLATIRADKDLSLGGEAVPDIKPATT